MRDHTRRVLVVDDDPSVHHEFRMTLERTSARGPGLAGVYGAFVGFKVDVAAEGEEALGLALAAVEEGRPHAAMFVDLRISPGWDGITTIKEIWKRCPDIEVVIYGALSDLSWSAIYGEFGETSRLLFLREPYGPAEIVQVALTLCSKWHLTQQNRRHTRELERTVAELRAEVDHRLQTERKLLHDSLHDPLTGLPNRTLFTKHLQGRLTTGPGPSSSLAAVALDINAFRIVTLGLGHDAADSLLVSISHRIRDALGSNDFLARAVGDVFWLVIETSPDPRERDLRVRDIQIALKCPFICGVGREIELTAAAGLCALDDPGISAIDVIRNMDTALSLAKRKGKGRTEIFTTQMRDQAIETLKIREELTVATRQNQFCLYYQPLIDFSTGMICGFEALIRWNHPTKGLVPPYQFIPVAEESHLIVPIGRWALEEACRQAVKFSQIAGYPLKMSVNVSGIQFTESDLLADMDHALAISGCPAENIKIEITETVLMSDAKTSETILVELRNRGVEIYIDDFGTGYSSLSYLHRFPVDALKIDRVFVAKMQENADDLAIVKIILGLAQTLGLQVVAEGVETLADAELLRQLGCPMAQGYYFGRPAPSEEAAKILAQGQPLFAIDLAS